MLSRSDVACQEFLVDLFILQKTGPAALEAFNTIAAAVLQLLKNTENLVTTIGSLTAAGQSVVSGTQFQNLLAATAINEFLLERKRMRLAMLLAWQRSNYGDPANSNDSALLQYDFHTALSDVAVYHNSCNAMSFGGPKDSHKTLFAYIDLDKDDKELLE